MRVLIYLPNWIGDAVMALPAVLRLGDARPEWEILLFAHPRVRPLFEGFDEPYRLLPAAPERGGGWRAFRHVVRRLRDEKADAALLLAGSARSAAVTRAAGIPRVLGWPTDGRLWLLTDPVGRPTRRRLQREQFLALAESFLRRVAERDDHANPRSAWPERLPLRAEEISWERRFRAEQGGADRVMIALAPGATYGPTKRWPEESFLELARRLVGRGFEVAWIGGAAETELCARLAAATGPGAHSFAGRLSLRETLSLLAGVRVTVSNDSGAMHLAQAAGSAVVGIFGSTAPEWTGPVGEMALVVQHPVPCAPCFRPECPFALECLTGITVDAVERAIDELCTRSAGRPGRPALFLDRDGVVIEEVNYLVHPEDVRLIPGVAAALRRQREAGREIVVVTNQSAVARGLIDRAGLQQVHARLHQLLRAEGVRLTGLEFCPHHPEFTGPCACRKPEPGMLRRAAHRHDLDLSRSWMIGDTGSDLAAGRAAGCLVGLVLSGHGRRTAARIDAGELQSPDRVADDLPELLSLLPLSGEAPGAAASA